MLLNFSKEWHYLKDKVCWSSRFYKSPWIGKFNSPPGPLDPWAFAKSTTPNLF